MLRSSSQRRTDFSEQDKRGNCKLPGTEWILVVHQALSCVLASQSLATAGAKNQEFKHARFSPPQGLARARGTGEESG